MERVTVPVPESLTASYLVPLPGPATAEGIRQRIIDAAAARLPGEFADCFRAWLSHGAISAAILTQDEAAGVLPDLEDATTRERTLIRTAGAFVRITATRSPSIVALHEWQARGCASFVAAESQAPVIDECAGSVLSAQEAFASLPELSSSSGGAGSAGSTGSPGDASLAGTGDPAGLQFSPHLWVRFHAFGYRGRYWAQSDGMKHFGLPEIFVGGTERDLREELRDIALCVAFRIWSDFARRAEAAAGAHDMFATPRALRIPAEMEINRKHLDGARGVPNRGGTASVAVRLNLDEGEHGQPVLAVAPPASWDMGWERFIGSVCHALFGFEKPPWHYLPELGVLLQALESVPEARRRFRDAELPSGGRMLVRYEDPADAGAPLRWGRVESWDDEGAVAVRDIGTELSPAVRPGDPVPVEDERIMDWAVWVDGQGVVEGARTETSGPA